jgi:hypothetical protein
MATDTVAQEDMTQEPDGVVTRVALQLRQFVCGLHGHEQLKHFERGRITLLCSSCGYETPGWDVKAAPARREGTDQSRVVSMPLVHRRTAA